MKNKRILTFAISTMLCLSSVLSTGLVFANNIDTDKKDMPFKIENEVVGKIKSISATSVVIEVASRKEMERPNDAQRTNDFPPEKPSKDGKQDNREKPNMDDMFTLTGDTKTIDISSAKFVSGFRGREKNEQSENNDKSIKKDENIEIKEKTYSDYSVGDYISIELTSETSQTAKTVRDAMFRGMRGEAPNGEPPKKK